MTCFLKIINLSPIMLVHQFFLPAFTFIVSPMAQWGVGRVWWGGWDGKNKFFFFFCDFLIFLVYLGFFFVSLFNLN